MAPPSETVSARPSLRKRPNNVGNAGTDRVKQSGKSAVKLRAKQQLAASGIDHCTKHDLRRTAVTWAMQRGADKWAAAGFFGLSLDMLESVYGHHHPDHLRSAVEAMERKA